MLSPSIHLSLHRRALAESAALSRAEDAEKALLQSYSKPSPDGTPAKDAFQELKVWGRKELRVWGWVDRRSIASLES